MNLLELTERPKGFLAEDSIDHRSEQFDYIRELHQILWRFVRVEYPDANGDLSGWLPVALAKAELRLTRINNHERPL